jgi:pimeloyl-ACP methyl ester carboxylesterase
VDDMMDQTYVIERGSGIPLVCLHGIGSSSGSFGPQLDELSRSHRVVAWDAPGYAQSPDPHDPPGMIGYATAVVDLIGRLADRVHLLGASWGGVIAMQVALDHPELLRSLVLSGSTVGSGSHPEGAAAMRARAGQLGAEGAARFARTRAPRLLSATATPELINRTEHLMAESLRLPGHDYAAQAMADTDLTARLSEISTPTLVICGEHDAITGPPASRILADGIPDAVYVSVDGAGHVVNAERPDAFNAWVSSFLQIIERLYP